MGRQRAVRGKGNYARRQNYLLKQEVRQFMPARQLSCVLTWLTNQRTAFCLCCYLLLNAPSKPFVYKLVLYCTILDPLLPLQDQACLETQRSKETLL